MHNNQVNCAHANKECATKEYMATCACIRRVRQRGERVLIWIFFLPIRKKGGGCT